MSRQLKPCGTEAAYQRHQRHGEPVDDACRAAHSAKCRAEHAARPGHQRRAPAVCGTAAGARAHYRRGEKPCEPCLVAARADHNQRNGHSGEVAAERANNERYARPTRNGLAEVAYIWRGRRYPWALRTIAAAEALYGRPDDDETVAS